MTERLSGRFWLPGASEQAVGGWLDLSEGRPVVEMTGMLTDDIQEVSRTMQPDGSVSVAQVSVADDEKYPDGITVHGMLRRGMKRVTLVGARTRRRTRVGAVSPVDPGEQVMQADYALVGGHITGFDTTFSKAVVRLRHLDAWAQLPGVAVTVHENAERVVIEYDDSDPIEAPVPGMAAKIVLDSEVEVPQPTVLGASVHRRAYLQLNMTDGLSVDVIWRTFVAPVSNLMTLCVDSDCPPVSLKLYSSELDRWLEVHRMELKSDEEDLLHPRDVFLTREALDLSHVARWLGLAPSLRPIPSLVAGVSLGLDRTIVNQLLEMAIAAEGLHRRIRPKERTMSLGQAEKLRRLARDAVPSEHRELVNSALLHLEQPTYAERLSHITSVASAAVPGVTGLTSLWEKKIKDVRNGFAHQLTPKQNDPDAQWLEYVTLLRTSRWVLTGVLLIQCGVSADKIAHILNTYEPYRFLLRKAKDWLPEVYSPSVTNSNTKGSVEGS